MPKKKAQHDYALCLAPPGMTYELPPAPVAHPPHPANQAALKVWIGLGISVLLVHNSLNFSRERLLPPTGHPGTWRGGRVKPNSRVGRQFFLT
jgi:hypothetical protein